MSTIKANAYLDAAGGNTDYVALADYDKSKPEVLAQRQALQADIAALKGA